MENLAAFLEQFPLDVGDFEPVPQKVIDQSLEDAPEFIMELWKQHGLCSFGNGFIWMLNPNDLSGIMDVYFPGAVAWMRTGLGGVFYTHQGETHYFSPVSLESDGFEELPMEYVINFTLSDKKTLEDLYYQPLYHKASTRLGKAAYDECFAFVPAIPMGGDLDSSQLQKAGLKEHLSFLFQLM